MHTHIIGHVVERVPHTPSPFHPGSTAFDLIPYTIGDQSPLTVFDVTESNEPLTGH